MVMFLPLFAIGASCLYVIFNKNAYLSYYGETINEDINNEVSYTGLHFNNRYKFSNDIGYTSISPREYIYTDYVVVYGNNVLTYDNITSIQLSSSETTTYIALYNDGNYITAFTTELRSYVFEFNYIGQQDLNLFPYQFYSIEYNDYSYLDNVFYYSCEQFKSYTLFNWAKSSFLAQPITYITNLFGMDSDNFVIYLLSYWLDISIIWLTFDLVMYVPLLVHRWLDKGVLE